MRFLWAVFALAASCGHANRPCPPARPVPSPAGAPPTADPATVAAIESTGARYQVCPGEPVYLIARDGKRELTEPELQTLQLALQATGAGVEASGSGEAGCLPPASRRMGVVLWVRDDTVPPEAFAHRLAAAIAELPGQPAARIQVTTRSTPPPRCTPDDPTCGPLPYQAACIERTDYDPKAPRKRVRSLGRAGECRHDGECFIAGCGNDCVPARGTDLAGTCERASKWDDVYCGCVTNECAWFTNE